VLGESGAILMYLADKYSSPLFPKDEKKRYEVIQWILFQMSGVGPMQGQAAYWFNDKENQVPLAIKRYQDEVLRLYEVLDKQLEGRDYITGEYSIADICTFPNVNGHAFAGLSIEQFPNLKRWWKTLSDKPTVQKGLQIPPPKQ